MTKEREDKQFYTLDELSRRWKVSRSTVGRYIDSLRVWRPSRSVIRVPATEVERFEREHMR